MHEECPYIEEGRAILAELRADIKALCQKIDKMLEVEQDVRALEKQLARLEERWKFVAGITGMVASFGTALVSKFIGG